MKYIHYHEASSKKGSKKAKNPSDRKLIGSPCTLTYIRDSGYIHTMKQMAKNFKALSDETRLRILALLSNSELCVCDLMAVLQLPQSTVSRHLAYLKHTEMVDDRRQGVWMYYRLASEDNCKLGNLLPELLKHLAAEDKAQQDLRHLQDYLEQKDTTICN